ncbi:MAG: hypothetical protein A2Y63_06125 [Candidatus Riflebacteria bacterium RBG_13_59_9]|nr:MAG: hypothetical protein A2Y63_06125 [Candidatus Riflebacteria bacterium RBG_13_59_9]
MSNVILVIIMVLADILGLGPGADIDARIEDALKAELGKKVQAVQVETHINKGSLLTKGKIAAIDFTLEGLWVKPVRIEEAYFNVEDIRINASKVLLGKSDSCLRSIGDISFRFTFLPQDLARALELRSENIREPEIALAGGQLVISGKYLLGPISTPFEVEGYLSYEGGSRIYYRINAVRVAGLGLPATFRKMIEDELNPLFDLGEFHEKRREEFERNEKMVGRSLKVEVKHIVVGDDRIVITGSV